MKIEITEEIIMNLICRYYKNIDCNGLLNETETNFKNTIESNLIIDTILEPIVINTDQRITNTDKDIYQYCGRLILPYNLFCRVNKELTATLNCSNDRS